MAKGKPNKHLHARISYLQRAATYMAACNAAPAETLGGSSAVGAIAVAERLSHDNDALKDPRSALQLQDLTKPEVRSLASTNSAPDQGRLADSTSGGLPFYISSQLRQVAQKSQIRLQPAVKRNACKVCNAVLIEGQTCSKTIENASRGRMKTQADVLVLECSTCGAKKRFPIGAKRPKRKGHRHLVSDHQNPRPQAS